MQLGIILTPYGQIPGAFPSEIGYSYGGNGTFLCPHDPNHNERGEPGMYYDTQLGAPAVEYPVGPTTIPQAKRGGDTTQAPHMGYFARMRAARIAKKLQGLGLGHSNPNDFDLTPYYGYTPVSDGWVEAREGFNPGTWIPPNGYSASGSYGPQMVPRALAGFGDAVLPASPVQPSPNQQPTAADLINTLNEHNQKIFTLSIISTIAIALSAAINTYRNSKLLKQETRLLRQAAAK